MSSSQAMTDVSLGHRWRQKEELPPTLCLCLQCNHANQAIYFKSTHRLDTIACYPRGRARTLCSGYQSS